MENNFYVGTVFYGKRGTKSEYSNKLVLYSEDNFNYLDLLTGIWYTTDKNNRDYVEEESVIPTDVSLYREDYVYMLFKYRESSLIRKKLYVENR